MQKITTARNYLFEQKLNNGGSKFFIYFPGKKISAFQDGTIVKMTVFCKKLKTTDEESYSFKNQGGKFTCSLIERVYFDDKTVDLLEKKSLMGEKTIAFVKTIFGTLYLC